jgi:hypothetical protein
VAIAEKTIATLGFYRHPGVLSPPYHSPTSLRKLIAMTHEQFIRSLISDPRTPREQRREWRDALLDAAAVYAVGDRIRVKGVDDPVTIIERTLYSETGQRYTVVHNDPSWTPPARYQTTTNLNYGHPRFTVQLADLDGQPEHEPEPAIVNEYTPSTTPPSKPTENTPSLFPPYRPPLPATLEEMYPNWSSETIAKYKVDYPGYKQYLTKPLC